MSPADLSLAQNAFFDSRWLLLVDQPFRSAAL